MDERNTICQITKIFSLQSCLLYSTVVPIISHNFYKWITISVIYLVKIQNDYCLMGFELKNINSLTWSWHCNDYWVILKLFMIFCICFLSIHLNFTIDGFSTVYKLFCWTWRMLAWAFINQKQIFINVWYLVLTFIKLLAILFFHNICGVAWTIEWCKSLFLAYY